MTVDDLAKLLEAGGQWIAPLLRDCTDKGGAAAYLGCDVKTLDTWRDEGRGPRWWQSARPMYPLADLIAWRAAREKEWTENGESREKRENTVAPGSTRPTESRRTQSNERPKK